MTERKICHCCGRETTGKRRREIYDRSEGVLKACDLCYGRYFRKLRNKKSPLAAPTTKGHVKSI